MPSASIPPLNPDWFRRAADHQARLTMPTGALGRLLDLGQQLCAIQETLTPRADPATVVVMAADHGIAEESVSAYPQEVTGQMLLNFMSGGAAINVLARHSQTRVLTVDMGVKHPPASDMLSRKRCIAGDRLLHLAIAPGTVNFLHGAAMTRQQAEQAIAVGRRVVAEELAAREVKVVALGEMGIGNTTSASALSSLLTGQPVEAVTGRGTGLDEVGWRHKVDVIQRSLDRHFPQRAGPVDPLAALTAVGGFEIAGLVGVALESAARRMVVVLDGFISTVAGLLAVRLEPELHGYCVAAHCSVEPGHRAVLEALDLKPLLDLGMRLGEGSGAALAIPLLQGAANIMREMATFESAGVRERIL